MIYKMFIPSSMAGVGFFAFDKDGKSTGLGLHLDIPEEGKEVTREEFMKMNSEGQIDDVTMAAWWDMLAKQVEQTQRKE